MQIGANVGDNEQRGSVVPRLSTGEANMQALAAIGIALALSAVTAIAGDFEDGLKYYQSKNYARAFDSWSKPAAQGFAPAQFTLGFMYEKGEGVKQDNKLALSW